MNTVLIVIPSLFVYVVCGFLIVKFTRVQDVKFYYSISESVCEQEISHYRICATCLWPLFLFFWIWPKWIVEAIENKIESRKLHKAQSNNQPYR